MPDTAARSGTWNAQGDIVLGSWGGGSGGPLWRVSAGGVVTAVTQVDASKGEFFHTWPTFLPDGTHFLYYRSGPLDVEGMYVGSLEADAANQSRERVLTTGVPAVFANDHIFFLRAGTPMAQPFDVRRAARACDVLWSPMAHLELVALVVRDYDEAIRFFVNVLRFALVEDTPSVTNDGRPKRWVVVRPVGGQTGILLARADGEHQVATVGQQFAGRVGLFLRVDDFDVAYRRMVASGVRFVSAPRDEAYGRIAVFLDLEGNRWDLLGPVVDSLPRP